MAINWGKAYDSIPGYKEKKQKEAEKAAFQADILKKAPAIEKAATKKTLQSFMEPAKPKYDFTKTPKENIPIEERVAKKPLKSIIEPKKPTYDFTKTPQQNVIEQFKANPPLMPRKETPLEKSARIRQEQAEARMQEFDKTGLGKYVINPIAGAFGGLARGTGVTPLLKAGGGFESTVKTLEQAEAKTPVLSAGAQLVGSLIPAAKATKAAQFVLNPVLKKVGAGAATSLIATETLAGAGLGAAYAGLEGRDVAKDALTGALIGGGAAGLYKGIPAAYRKIKGETTPTLTPDVTPTNIPTTPAPAAIPEVVSTPQAGMAQRPSTPLLTGTPRLALPEPAIPLPPPKVQAKTLPGTLKLPGEKVQIKPTTLAGTLKVVNKEYEKVAKEYENAIQDIQNYFGTNELRASELARVKKELGIDLNNIVSRLEKAESKALLPTAKEAQLKRAAGVSTEEQYKLLQDITAPAKTFDITEPQQVRGFINQDKLAQKFKIEREATKIPEAPFPKVPQQFRKETPFTAFKGELQPQKPTAAEMAKIEPKPLKPEVTTKKITKEKKSVIKEPIKTQQITTEKVTAKEPVKTIEIPETQTKIPVKEFVSATTTPGKFKISQTRLNTIANTTEFKQKSKEFLPEKEFGYEMQTAKEWKEKGMLKYMSDKQGVIDDIVSDRPLREGADTMAASYAIKEAEKQAVKSGNYENLLTLTKKYAEKLRENARALKAHDLAWEKAPNGANTIRKAQQIIDDTQETILKSSKKLRNRIDSDFAAINSNIEKSIKEATIETMKTLRLNLQLFAKIKPDSLEKLIGRHFSTDPLKRGDIIDKLVKQFGLDGDEAKKLAERINFVFEQKFNRASENYLRRLLKAENKQNPTLEKIMKLIRAGAYDDTNIRNVLKEKYGLPVLTADEAKKLVKMVDDLNKMNVDSKDYAIQLARIRAMIEEKEVKTWVDRQRAIKNVSLLYNPATILTNLAGNVTLGTLDIATQSTIGTIVDKLLSLRYKQRTTGVSNVSKLFSGAIEGAKDATIDMAGGLRLRDLQGLTTKQKVAAVIDGIQRPIQRPIFEQTENKFELSRGLAFKGKNKYQYSDSEVKRKIGNFIGKTGKVGRVIENQLYYSLNLFDRSAKQAHYDDTLNTLMKLNKIKEPTEELKRLAETIALERTVTDVNLLSDIGRWIQALPQKQKNNPKIARMIEFSINSIFPFMTTPLNIAKRSIEYSPLGLAEGFTQLGIALAKKEQISLAQQRYIVDRISRGLAGTTMLLLGMAAYDKGIATGKVPKSKDMREFFNQLEILPNAIKIGDMYIDLTKLQPITTTFIAGVNLKKSVVEGIKKGEKQGVIESTDNMLRAIGDAFEFYTDMPVIQGLKKLLPSSFDEKTFGENLVEFALSIPQQYYPSLLKKYAYTSDVSERSAYEASTLQEKLVNPLLKMTPKLRERLAKKIGTLGQEIKTFGGNNSFWNVYFNPVRTGKAEPTQVQSEILRLYESTNDTSVFPNVFTKTLKLDNGKQIVLNNQQMMDYQRLMGENVNKTIEQILAKSGYDELPDTSDKTNNTKLQVIRRAIENSVKFAKSEMAKQLGETNEKKTKKQPLRFRVPNEESTTRRRFSSFSTD